MSTVIIPDKLKTLAKNLSEEPPRSPRETLAGYIIAARTLDKCRAHLNGTAGEYNFNRKMDQLFFEFTSIKAEDFTAFVSTGASDEEVADWIRKNSKVTERIDIVKWNNRMRYATLSDLPDPMQEYMEDYIEQHVPKGRIVYHFFDVFDLEEGRL